MPLASGVRFAVQTSVAVGAAVAAVAASVVAVVGVAALAAVARKSSGASPPPRLHARNLP